ncbi:MAG: DNA repair protein RadA [Nitrospinae bacterium]|nr:DNA repair protein RadA [Nitrospinota bacterium]
MKKSKSVYVCQNCGFRQSKWAGRCPECDGWNSMVEEAVRTETAKDRRAFAGDPGEPVPLGSVSADRGERIPSGMGEMDRVLGGGIVPGSLVLIGGDPGIGKSTLLLQLCGHISTKKPVLYVSGEESAGQIKMRAERLGVKSDTLLLYTETSVEMIIQKIADIKPAVVVIDSIQTMFTEAAGSAPGSVGQLRESAAILMQVSKKTGVPIFLVGHVTKEGAIAGPRVLEHIVDTVLYFEGDRDHFFRILRSVKNRFGSTHEMGVFEMRESGLTEVANPSEIFMSRNLDVPSGSVVTCILSGTRPILVEIQALVTGTSFGNPRRTAVGFDYNRLALLAAILQKRAGLVLDQEDIYVSAAGGVRVEDPGADLALAAAIVGSFQNRAARKSSMFVGEVGLGGELRPVSSLSLRVKEAARMGLKRAYVPKGSPLGDVGSSLEIIEVGHVGSLAELMF